MEVNKIATKILAENKYLSLATSGKQGVWISPLFYVTDKEHNLYFISAKDSLHAQNVETHPQVAVAIFNSTLPPEEVNGIQASGIASKLKLREVAKAIEIIYSYKFAEILKSRFQDYRNPLSYTKLTKFRIYKIELSEVFVLDPDETKADTRIRVSLQKGKH